MFNSGTGAEPRWGSGAQKLNVFFTFSEGDCCINIAWKAATIGGRFKGGAAPHPPNLRGWQGGGSPPPCPPPVSAIVWEDGVSYLPSQYFDDNLALYCEYFVGRGWILILCTQKIWVASLAFANIFSTRHTGHKDVITLGIIIPVTACGLVSFLCSGIYKQEMGHISSKRSETVYLWALCGRVEVVWRRIHTLD